MACIVGSLGLHVLLCMAQQRFDSLLHVKKCFPLVQNFVCSDGFCQKHEKPQTESLTLCLPIKQTTHPGTVTPSLNLSIKTPSKSYSRRRTVHASIQFQQRCFLRDLWSRSGYDLCRRKNVFDCFPVVFLASTADSSCCLRFA